MTVGGSLVSFTLGVLIGLSYKPIQKKIEYWLEQTFNPNKREVVEE